MGNLIQDTTVYFMKSQILCSKLGRGWRKREQRKKWSWTTEWLGAVAYELVEEDGDTQFASFLSVQAPGMRMQAGNTVAQGTGKLEHLDLCGSQHDGLTW